MPTRRTLLLGLRVGDRERSLAFYRTLGYEVVGTVPSTSIGHLTMLKLPADPFVTLELVDAGAPVRQGDNFSHLVVQVESMREVVALLAAAGLGAEVTSPDGTEEFLVAMLADPDGNAVELVQWPPGHAEGMTAADFAAASLDR